MKKFFLLAFIAGALQTGTCIAMDIDTGIDSGPKSGDPVSGQGRVGPSEVPPNWEDINYFLVP